MGIIQQQNAESYWGSNYFIGQGENFESYNLTGVTLNNNQTLEKNKRWVQKLSIINGETIFDYTHMYIICNFDREIGEFINTSNRFFTLELMYENTTETFIKNQKSSQGGSVWYKEFDSGNVAIVFKIPTNKIKDNASLIGFKTTITNNESGNDRKSSREYLFNTDAPRTTLYFTGGTNPDIVNGTTTSFRNNRIKKISVYGKNQNIGAIKLSGGLDYFFHNGKINISYQKTRYRSDDIKIPTNMRIYYENENEEYKDILLTNGQETISGIDIGTEQISKIDVSFDGGNNWVLFSTSNIQYWSTYLVEQLEKAQIDEGSYYHKVIKTQDNKVTVQNKLKFNLQLDKHFPILAEENGLLSFGENSKIPLTKTLYNNMYSFSGEIIEDVVYDCSNNASVLNTEKMPSPLFNFKFASSIDLDNVSMSTVGDTTLQKAYTIPQATQKYALIGTQPKIYYDSTSNYIKGNIMCPPEFLKYALEQAKIVDMETLTKIEASSASIEKKPQFCINSENKMEITTDTMSSSDYFKFDNNWTISYENIVSNNLSGKWDSENKTITSTQFLYFSVLCEYNGTTVITPVEKIQLSRALGITATNIQIQGSTLSYTLTDNGSDVNDIYPANDFVVKRYDNPPEYFGYAREDKKEKLVFTFTYSDQEATAALLFNYGEGNEIFSSKVLYTILSNFIVNTKKKIDFSELSVLLNDNNFKGIVTFLENNQGKKVALNISLYYQHSTNTLEELFSSDFEITIEGGLPSFGIRKKGVIINPKPGYNDFTNDEYGQILNVMNESNKQEDAGKMLTALTVNLFNDVGTIQLSKPLIQIGTGGILVDGANIDTLNKIVLSDETILGERKFWGLEKITKMLDINQSGSLAKQVQQNITNISNLSTKVNGLTMFRLEKEVGTFSQGSVYFEELVLSDTRIKSTSYCIARFDIHSLTGSTDHARIHANAFTEYVVGADGKCTVGVSVGAYNPSSLGSNYSFQVRLQLYVINLPTLI